MIQFLKNLFKKKPKYYKIPLFEQNGKDTGLYTEFVEGDNTYQTLIKVYGKIPNQIILD